MDSGNIPPINPISHQVSGDEGKNQENIQSSSSINFFHVIAPFQLLIQAGSSVYGAGYGAGQWMGRIIYQQLSHIPNNGERASQPNNEEAINEEELENLMQTFEIIENVSPKSELSDLKSEIGLDLGGKAQTVSVVKPLALNNVGNSCYMASALQSILCLDGIGDVLHSCRPLPEDGTFKDKSPVWNELIKFTHPPTEEDRSSSSSYFGSLFSLLSPRRDDSSGDGPSLSELRKAIFDSKLHVELESDHLYDQLDAASVVELLFREFLPYKIKSQPHLTTETFPGFEYIYRPETMTTLQLEIHDQDKTLQDLLHSALNRPMKGADTARIFNPNNQNINQLDQLGVVAQVINEEEADKAPKQSQTVSEYQISDRLIELPDVIPLHLKRFEVRMESGQVRFNKIHKEIECPKNGIVDLKDYCDLPEGASQNTRYEIVSYVQHSGTSINRGHYIAYVKKDGHYWKCDDGSITEIEQNKFLESSSAAYLVILRRLPEVKEEPV